MILIEDKKRPADLRGEPGCLTFPGRKQVELIAASDTKMAALSSQFTKMNIENETNGTGEAENSSIDTLCANFEKNPDYRQSRYIAALDRYLGMRGLIYSVMAISPGGPFEFDFLDCNDGTYVKFLNEIDPKEVAKYAQYQEDNDNVIFILNAESHVSPCKCCGKHRLELLTPEAYGATLSLNAIIYFNDRFWWPAENPTNLSDLWEPMVPVEVEKYWEWEAEQEDCDEGKIDETVAEEFERAKPEAPNSLSASTCLLLDGEEMHRTHPKTFEIHSSKAKRSLRPGDDVKICVEEFTVERDGEKRVVPGERIWLRIDEIAWPRFKGHVLSELLFKEHQLKTGDSVEFEACHILDLKMKEMRGPNDSRSTGEEVQENRKFWRQKMRERIESTGRKMV